MTGMTVPAAALKYFFGYHNKCIKVANSDLYLDYIHFNNNNWYD